MKGVKTFTHRGIAVQLVGAGFITILIIGALWATSASLFLWKADNAIQRRMTSRKIYVFMLKARLTKNEFLLMGNESVLQERQKLMAELEQKIKILATLSPARDQKAITKLQDSLQIYIRHFTPSFLRQEFKAVQRHDEWKRSYWEMDHAMQEMETLIEQLLNKAADDSDRARKDLILASGLILLFGLGLAAMIFYGFAASIARPIIQLKESALRVGKGDLDYATHMEAPGEVGILAKTLQEMVHNLHLSQERFEIVAQATNDIVWDWDLVTNHVWWNEHVYRQLHFMPGEVGLTAQWWTEHIHPDDQQRVMDSIHRSFEEGKQIWSEEYRFQAVDGNYLTVFDRGFVIYNEAKQPIRMIGAMMDISERKRLEAAIIQSEKMAGVGQFAAGVAHDINNPIAVILGFVETLLRRGQEGDPFRAPLKAIEREGLRCKALVQNLLAFSRSQKQEVTAKPEDLRQVIEGALTLVSTLTLPKKIELIRTFAENLPLISIDANQIQQVVINLCTNAMDAMPQGGKLTVGLAQKDAATVAIFVQDTGMGISPEIRGKIFNAFFTTKEVGKGTGLGLSLISTIVKNHHGRIDLQSEPGKGSTFTVLLPANSQFPISKAA